MSPVQYNWAQCSTVQKSSIDYSTVHYSTVQYSTVQWQLEVASSCCQGDHPSALWYTSVWTALETGWDLFIHLKVIPSSLRDYIKAQPAKRAGRYAFKRSASSRRHGWITPPANPQNSAVTELAAHSQAWVSQTKFILYQLRPWMMLHSSYSRCRGT